MRFAPPRSPADADNAAITPLADAERETLRRLWSGHLSAQAALCAELERIADGLPDNVEPQKCLHIARTIYPLVRHAHEFEESVLFPRMAELYGPGQVFGPTAERLKFEHWEDESYAEEIYDAMNQFLADRSRARAEMLAYMLRGFFEGLTRHLAFEREHLMPILVRA